MYLVDADFRIREVNPVAIPVFGDIPGGVDGRDFDEIIHMLWEKEYADEVVRIFRRTLETGEPYITPERAKFRIDRRIIEYYEWRVDRILLPDGRNGVVCYFRDISAQVLARKAIEESREALREADRRKDEFLAILSHELRNPLAPIRNAVELLRDAHDDAAVAEQAHGILARQVAHLTRLVDDLLEMSRVSRGTIRLQRSAVDLAEIMANAVETSRPAIVAAGHELEVILPDKPVMLHVDAVRIAQILANLLNNAAKYTRRGGRIWLTASAKGHCATISVRDNGSGITREILPRVFDMFVRGGSPADGGLGIGLSLSRTLAEMHGGTIDVGSEGPGQGSEFVLRLPIQDASQPAASDNDVRASAASPTSRRVLVVDDNVDAAESLGMLLRQMGHEVQIVFNGRAAVQAAREHAPDVVLLDLGLPDIDGYEVAERLRKDLGLDRVPIVAVTGHGRERERQRSREAGFREHLMKPVAPETLRALMSAC